MKFAAIFLLLSGSFSGFSQSDAFWPKPRFRCVEFRASVLDKPVPAAMPLTESGLSKIEFCDALTEKGARVKYKPLVCDWTAVSQRIQDYKMLYPIQDINGRDLMLDVITNEMTDRLLGPILPH